MEQRLIEEMAKMKGGRGRLRRLRDEFVADAERLTESIDRIEYILEENQQTASDPEEEAVDSLGE